MFVIPAWLLIALASHVYMIYAARAIAGFCVGVASLSLPVYLAETVQPEVRGMLGLLPTSLGNVGILICFVAGSFMTWDHLAYLGAAISIPFLIAMMYIPETPRWYIAKGNNKSLPVMIVTSVTDRICFNAHRTPRESSCRIAMASWL